jgi:hypothetical protein
LNGVRIRASTLNLSCVVQDIFRFYVFTMGDKAYAESMAGLLDPEHRHFRGRVVNRSDALSSCPGTTAGGRQGQPHLLVKTLQQVGISSEVAAVLDDTSGEPASEPQAHMMVRFAAQSRRWILC